jgi:dipeptidyl aminopeptidase/acylaminoacyl peptidase
MLQQKRLFIALVFAVSCRVALSAAPVSSVREVHYQSSADHTQQPAMFYSPAKLDAVPLLVVLHTWHSNYKQTYQSACADWCVKKDWAYLHPDFRGPNTQPEATGSELVVQDIADGVEYAKRETKIDASRIYLLGTSGGGYTALLMAGRRPDLWAGVSAWVPISDLAAWYGEIKKSGRENCEDISRSCGGTPGVSEEVDREYYARSPLSYLEHARGLPLDINAGIRDGHDGSVPISHSLRAFNAVAAAEDRISPDDIRFFVDEAAVPPKLQRPIADPTYGDKRPLFRRSSGAVRVTIFQGKHELVPQAALEWLSQQRKKD